MKRYSGLFEQIYDFENLELAYKKARRNKRYRNEVLRFTANKEEYLINLQNHLMWETFEVGVYRTFMVTEPKTRIISALPFPDRVVQHAIVNIIEPIFERRMFYHSYACRKGRGLHAASTQLTKWIRNLSYEGEKLYVLKCDIHHYFQTINHDILKALLARAIDDERTLRLLGKIIDSNGLTLGIPVGNLTSQLFANIYLDVLDKFVKEQLREKYYIRYMDDFLIISTDPNRLRYVLGEIDSFIIHNLALTLNPSTTMLCANNGIDFVGYRHFYDHKRVRKSNIRRIRKKIKAYNKGTLPTEAFGPLINAWLAHASHADSLRLRESILATIDNHDPLHP
jgi:retron-type reverse transcriptase